MPSTPPLTGENLPDQSNKVFLITGAAGGVGLELAQILYRNNAKVYIAGRSAAKAETAIAQLKKNNPHSTGSLIFLKLDLNDLATVKASVEQFLSHESRLDVLWNNAGVMTPPQGSLTAQGYELQLGTNCVAPFLFTKLLTPILVKTAKTAVAGSVRVVWVSSSAAQRFAPVGGIEIDNLDYHDEAGAWKKYGISKAGNILHAKEMAYRHKADGIVSLALDPGNLKTDLYKHVPWWQKPVINLVLKDPVYGAFTELYAGLSPEITLEDNGVFVEPWGKRSHAREDIEKAAKQESEGGTGQGARFWQWSEKQIEKYL